MIIINILNPPRILCYCLSDPHRRIRPNEISAFYRPYKYGLLIPFVPTTMYILSRLAWNRASRVPLVQSIRSDLRVIFHFVVTTAIHRGLIPQERDILKKNGYLFCRQFLLSYYMLPKKKYLLKFTVATPLVTVPIFLVLKIIEAHVLFTFLFLIAFFGTIVVASSYLISTSGKVSLLFVLNFRSVRQIDNSLGYKTLWGLFILSLDILTALVLVCIFLAPAALTIWLFWFG